MKGVYVLHFDKPLAHAQHYIGYSTNIDNRVAAHKRGETCAFMKAVVEAGIEVELVRVYEGAGQTFERHLKNQKNARCLCPKCREAKLARLRAQRKGGAGHVQAGETAGQAQTA